MRGSLCTHIYITAFVPRVIDTARVEYFNLTDFYFFSVINIKKYISIYSILKKFKKNNIILLTVYILFIHIVYNTYNIDWPYSSPVAVGLAWFIVIIYTYYM